MTIEELKSQVEKVIKTVYDPELPVDIWELGLIYDVQITADSEVVVLMTLTAPNCPEAGGIPIEVEEKIKQNTRSKRCQSASHIRTTLGSEQIKRCRKI